jgi:hypothetical protein
LQSYFRRRRVAETRLEKICSALGRKTGGPSFAPEVTTKAGAPTKHKRIA